jgi:hypothetical protein
MESFRIIGLLHSIHCPEFQILENNVSETRSSGEGRETPSLLHPLKRVGVSSPHMRMETDPVSKTLHCPVFRIADDG